LNGIGSHLDYDASINSKITEIVHAISVYIRMDWDWINLPRINVEYEKGVEEFIKFLRNVMRVEVMMRWSLYVLVSIVWMGENWMQFKLGTSYLWWFP